MRFFNLSQILHSVSFTSNNIVTSPSYPSNFFSHLSHLSVLCYRPGLMLLDCGSSGWGRRGQTGEEQGEG